MSPRQRRRSQAARLTAKDKEILRRVPDVSTLEGWNSNFMDISKLISKGKMSDERVVAWLRMMLALWASLVGVKGGDLLRDDDHECD